MRYFSIFFLCLLFLLPGCKWLNSKNKDNIDPPAPLVDIKTQISLKRLWSHDIGDVGKKQGLVMRPAYVQEKILVANVDGVVSALHSDTGKPLWEIDFHIPFSSGIGAFGNIAAIGSINGLLLALDNTSGTELWRAHVSSEIIATPIIQDDLLVVRSLDGRLFAFNSQTGKQLWVYDRTVPLLTLRGNGVPIITAQAVYAGYDDGKLVALNPDDGKVLWEQVIAEPEGRTEIERTVDIDGHLEYHDSELYTASYHGRVAALTIDAGRILWTRDISAYSGVSVFGRQVFVSDDASTIWSLDTRSGSALWKQDSLAYRWLSTPIAMSDYVVVGDFEGYVHWLNAETGKVVARERVGKKAIRTMPLVVGKNIYVLNTDGTLAAYHIDS